MQVRRFVKYLILFFLPIMVLAFAAEAYLRSLPNEYAFKNDWITANADKLQTLVIGSSKGYYGVRPQFFSSNAFNLATISERPDYDCFLVEKFIKQCKKLKTVIYPVFYEIFVDPPFEQCEEWPRASYFKMYMDCPFHSDFSKYNLEISSVTAATDKYRNFKVDGGMGCDSLGYGIHCQLKNKNITAWKSGEEARASALRHTNRDSRFVEYNFNYVNRVAEMCRENHVRLMLVAFPCDKRYVKCLDKAQLKQFYDLTEKIKQDNNAEFHDFMNDPRFSDRDFFDSNHLSEIGAQKFTCMLDSLIENI